jgi:hypothetical protein
MFDAGVHQGFRPAVILHLREATITGQAPPALCRDGSCSPAFLDGMPFLLIVYYDCVVQAKPEAEAETVVDENDEIHS